MQATIPTSNTPERIPAPQRLGDNEQSQHDISERVTAELSAKSQERILVSLRLGEHSKSPESQSRRLGPPLLEELAEPKVKGETSKRKPGRPPGKRKIQASPTLKKRRITLTSRIPKCHKQLNSDEVRIGTKQIREKKRGETSRHVASGGNSQSSDNVPLSRMIPKVTRRKPDFQVPAAPAP